jgi:uncharacterized protein (TIGR02246 family)
MYLRLSCLLTISALLLLSASTSAGTAQAADQTAAEDGIRAAAAKYIAALAAGDSQTMLSMWAEGGDVVDPVGRSRPATEVVPQQAAAQVEAAANGHPNGPTPKILDNSIRLITDNVAIEDGRVEATGTNGTSRQGRFTAIWVKESDQWKLASLREVHLQENPGAALDGLDWMVGRWQGESGGAKFEISAHWNDKHTFLLRDLTVSADGKTLVNGEQRIGLDPASGQIRSWMHDQDGGHGEGIWSKHGDAWVVQATGVTPDGRHTTGTNIYKPDGPDKFTWKSIGSTAAGQAMPDFEIQLERTDMPPKN